MTKLSVSTLVIWVQPRLTEELLQHFVNHRLVSRWENLIFYADSSMKYGAFAILCGMMGVKHALRGHVGRALVSNWLTRCFVQFKELRYPCTSSGHLAAQLFLGAASGRSPLFGLKPLIL